MERVEHVKQYYTCIDIMKQKFDKYARKHPVNTTSVEAYERWSDEARQELFQLFGMDKMEKCNLNSKMIETVELDNDIKREKWIIEVEPSVFMPFYILYPARKDMRYIQYNGMKKPACVIAPHGHQGGGKESIVGRNEIPAIADAIKKFEYDYGMQLVKDGYVTICPDARGYMERREAAFQKDEESSYLSGTCYHLAHMAEPLGMTVMGMLVWDLMRLVDFIYEQDQFDVSELGCVGFSGGGMQTLMTAALDLRIKKMIISGYLYGYKDSLLILNGNCNCNYVPHLWEYFDMGDIGALLAPRKVIIQSCESDHLNGPRGLINVVEQMDIMRTAYALYHEEAKLTHDVRPGGHCWHGEVLVNF